MIMLIRPDQCRVAERKGNCEVSAGELGLGDVNAIVQQREHSTLAVVDASCLAGGTHAPDGLGRLTALRADVAVGYGVVRVPDFGSDHEQCEGHDTPSIHLQERIQLMLLMQPLHVKNARDQRARLEESAPANGAHKAMRLLKSRTARALAAECSARRC